MANAARKFTAPVIWPEAPADYPRRATFVPQIDPERIARALNDRAMLEALHREQRIRDLRGNLPLYRDQLRARVWIGIFVSFGIVAGVLIGLVAHAETATHTASAVNG